LNSPHSNPEEQYKIFTQLFTRFLNIESESKQPLKVILQNEPDFSKIESEPQNNIEGQFDWSNIIHGIPKNKRIKAIMFISEIYKTKIY